MWFICTFLNLNNNTWVFIATMIEQVVITILNLLSAIGENNYKYPPIKNV